MKIFQRVVDRRQDYRVSEDYPYGTVVETLSCGHERIEVITYEDARPSRWAVRDRAMDDIENPAQHHQAQADRRRCRECEKGAAK